MRVSALLIYLFEIETEREGARERLDERTLRARHCRRSSTTSRPMPRYSIYSLYSTKVPTFAGGHRQPQDRCPGTQFTRVTFTNVQILTPEELRARRTTTPSQFTCFTSTAVQILTQKKRCLSQQCKVTKPVKVKITREEIKTLEDSKGRQ